MTTDLQKIWYGLTKLHVAQKEGRELKVAELIATERDERHLNFRGSCDSSITGDGSREKPYVLPASDHSSFLGFIAVWLSRRNEIGKFIEMNDWFLKITATGLRADDGVLTNLKKFLK